MGGCTRSLFALWFGRCVRMWVCCFGHGFWKLGLQCPFVNYMQALKMLFRSFLCWISRDKFVTYLCWGLVELWNHACTCYENSISWRIWKVQNLPFVWYNNIVESCGRHCHHTISFNMILWKESYCPIGGFSHLPSVFDIVALSSWKLKKSLLATRGGNG